MLRLSEEWRVWACLRTGLEEGRVDTITDCALVVVVLVAQLVTDRVVVERADTMANYFLAVFSFLGLFLRFLWVAVPAESPLAVQCRPT